MGQMLAAQGPDVRIFPGPVHRLIVVVDIEGSTMRTNPVKGQLRHDLYDLLERALQGAGIAARHLEEHTDRGDGVLMLIRPYDDVPKTLVLGRLMPVLAALLVERNASVGRPELRLRLRAVVHAGEVHGDDRGFYGDDIDTACRLLDAPKLKRALRDAAGSPLVLGISDEIYTGIVQHGYLNAGPFRPLGRIRVGNRIRRGWIHVPAPVNPDQLAVIPRPRSQAPATAAVAARATGAGLARPARLRGLPAVPEAITPGTAGTSARRSA